MHVSVVWGKSLNWVPVKATPISKVSLASHWATPLSQLSIWGLKSRPTSLHRASITALWIIEHIVCINDCNSDFIKWWWVAALPARAGPIWFCDRGSWWYGGAHRIPFPIAWSVETSDHIKGRNGAAIVRWNTPTRMADQEGEVESFGIKAGTTVGLTDSASVWYDRESALFS